MRASRGPGRQAEGEALRRSVSLAVAAFLVLQMLAPGVAVAAPSRTAAPRRSISASVSRIVETSGTTDSSGTAEPSGTVAPGRPQWLSPPAGSKPLVSPVAVKVRAGADTATLTLMVNGEAVRSVACTSGAAVSLGSAKLRKGANVVTVTATGSSGETSSAVSRAVTRKEWPHNTCIVIDKSDYRLYWVVDQQLVASYKIAHGRHNWTPVRTWKILAKYKTAPGSIYGPRKMRMFRRVGSKGHYRYVFTRYAIHGTNQPSLIGTQASHGCIRMYNKDVLKLWPQVRIGTFVVTRA